jgi:serine/threonine protein kinase
MARFQREAELLASLNHPNITTLYGITDGALVMEFIEDDSLPCPLHLCLGFQPIARQNTYFNINVAPVNVAPFDFPSFRGALLREAYQNPVLANAP